MKVSSGDTLTDEELVSRITVASSQREAEELFSQLYDRYKKTVFSMVRNKTYNFTREDIEDTAQEVFIRVNTYLNSYDPSKGCKFKTYFFQISISIINDCIRKKHNSFSVGKEELDDYMIGGYSGVENIIDNITAAKCLFDLYKFGDRARNPVEPRIIYSAYNLFFDVKGEQFIEYNYHKARLIILLDNFFEEYSQQYDLSKNLIEADGFVESMTDKRIDKKALEAFLENDYADCLRKWQEWVVRNLKRKFKELF